MRFKRRDRDPDDPQQVKAWVIGVGVALTIMSIGLLTWMALDVDGDGMSSYSELQAGTSPTSGDTDGDGVADGWEILHGYDPLSADSTPDLQAGGLGDLSASGAGGNQGALLECNIGDVLAGCDDADADTVGAPEAPSQEAGAAPQAGGNGVGTTSAIGVGTTLLASVAGRVIAVRVLHS